MMVDRAGFEPAASASFCKSMRRRRSCQTELPALLSFESKTIFNSIERLPSQWKNFVLFVLALDFWFGHAELLFSSFPWAVFFVLLFALFALVCECAAVEGVVLFPLIDFFGFLSHLFKGGLRLHPLWIRSCRMRRIGLCFIVDS